MVTDTARSQRLDRFEAVVLSAVAVVAIVGAVSLLLAAMGAFRWWVWLPVAGAVCVAIAISLLRRSFGHLLNRSWMVVVPVALVALVLMLPGYRYSTGDKDPGVYVMHAWNMAHTGHLPFQKTALQMSGALTSTDYPGALWRGFEFSTSATQVMPSFFHMWPALLAAGMQLVGFNALAVTGPLLGVLGVVVLFALVRRLFGVHYATVASLLLAVNMMQVWQARYPTSEVLAQVMYLGTALALVIAVQTRSQFVAFLAGVCATCGFMVRAEGVVALVFFGGMLALLALNAQHRRVVLCGWCGALVLLPLAWWQAYGWAERYALANGTPRAVLVGACVAGELLLTAAALAFGGRLLGRAASMVCWVQRPTVRNILAAGVVAGFVASALRPLAGVSMWVRNGAPGRSFDERSLHRLAMFFTWPGLLLALAGAVAIVVQRRQRDLLMFTAVSLFYVVLFLYHARNSPQMMWWNRRFVPSVVPALVVFAAVGVVDGRQWLQSVLRERSVRLRHVVSALVALAALFAIAVPARQSWYLRANDEKSGSFTIARNVASLAKGEPAVFLWQRGQCCSSAAMLFGSPTWVYGGVDSGLLPVDPTLWEEYIGSVHDAAPDLAVYVVLHHDTQPPNGGYVATPVQRFNGALHAWEESNITRPSHVIALPYDVEVYRIGWSG